MNFIDKNNTQNILNPIKRTIFQQRERLLNKKSSAVDSITSFLDEMEQNKHLNIFITELRDEAMKSAKRSDERISRGKALPLDGIPIAVKDNFCTKGIRTTAASKMLENFIPTYESTVTKKLRDAGAVIIGKTNMDEFAMGSSTETSYFGATINPVGYSKNTQKLVPGGSSGGSAAAVAANLALGAIGTDTGGSIRQPASFCGIVGFKPTYGVCSRWGIVAYASSLDQAGVLTKSVQDAAILMDVISGFDEKDSTSYPKKLQGFEAAINTSPRPLRIGFVKEVMEAGVTNEANRIWKSCREIANHLNAEITELSIPTFKYSLPAYYIIALSEASSNLARYDGVRYGYRTPHCDDVTAMYENTRSEGFGEEVERRIMLGTFSLSSGYYDAYYLKAQKVRNKLRNEFEKVFSEVDVLFMPTTPNAAFSLGAHSADPVDMYLQDIYTVAVNLVGLPAISLPVAASESGLPLGLQIIGKSYSDVSLLRTAASVEVAAALLR
ncbi:MAG: Asp-tRNA(Asn)/Glu-tRNA(Gln) amidotransferase subunit GatA [Aliivibrio sp.]|uniref:Asp-tRNA(Asn)/Glu-tRNA(Gln) amidotransferase subunit GatA n=1 Tax=Aliivibrio sp. TaxID=1872443 RepID=UPI001A569E53|nr:Asp-tRNA(Asn)/Glu-tRNA(Gln) amidotransferase subunit GatA [Aliivibrio sp.]